MEKTGRQYFQPAMDAPKEMKKYKNSPLGLICKSVNVPVLTKSK